jgi:hypothetical protein
MERKNNEEILSFVKNALAIPHNRDAKKNKIKLKR